MDTKVLKVRQNRNVSFKPTIPPKNERTNSVLLPNNTINAEFFRLLLGRIRRYQKVLLKVTDLYQNLEFIPFKINLFKL